ncbi:MAG: NAD(P)-dependent oxidoreductase [Actinomycetia bacterium]|nr:NAD(P)-dependent oxidoreductase [Actinomycetes bacterium]
MLGLNKKLKDLQSRGGSIRVAIVGMGQMGSSMTAHLKTLPGMDVIAAASRDVNSAAKILKSIGLDAEDMALVESGIKVSPENADLETIKAGGADRSSMKKQISSAIASGRTIVTDEIGILTGIEEVDVVVDATGNTEAGAQIAFSAINNKKHVVTFNVEADTTIGPLLKKMADNAGIVYTLAAGDEPAAAKELFDMADALGLEVIAAGKGKNNPLDREANPDTLAEYAARKGASARMMTSFVDGTKSMVEMACLSNATGLVPDVRGMHGASVNVSELAGRYSLKEDGGILSRKGVVEFAIGDVAPGVFLVYTSHLKIIRDELKYLLFGDGPNYLLYRPYHLTSIEAPLSVARAYFLGEPTIVPMAGLISEVVTYGKKDLKAGELLDGIGAYATYGMIEHYEIAREENLLPMGLSEGCRLKNNIQKGQPITYNDVELVEGSMILQLRRQQDGITF